MATTKRLTAIANECKTDKGTTHRQGHGYTPLYEMLLEPLRDKPIQLLEVGLCIGGPELHGSPDRAVMGAPSVRMWHEFFPKAHIHGIDISDFSAFENEWFSFYRADCGDAKQLEAAAARCPPDLDLIIDDGSHASYHQQLTLCKLLPRLKQGGLYIIEDMQWQPADYERSLPKTIRTDRLLSTLIQTGRFPPNCHSLTSELAAIEPLINNVILFDEDYLFELRRFYNHKYQSKPDIPNYLDASHHRRFLLKGYARRLLEDSALLAKTAFGLTAPVRRPRIKLAVIQKS